MYIHIQPAKTGSKLALHHCNKRNVMKMLLTTVDFEHVFWLDYKLFFVGHVFEKYKD